MAALVVLLVLVSLTSLTKASMHVPALYVFGDSIVDGGNTDEKTPYGVDLKASVSIRHTNGETIADFIASFLGLPLVPPSTKISKMGITKTGVNYGHSGCGILRETGPKNCSCEDQIREFNSTLATNLTKIFNQHDIVQHVTRSVFLISFGINDYTNNYLPPNNGVVSKMAPNDFAKILLNELSAGLKKLYSLGARKFVVNNIWPLGCTPIFVNQWDPMAVSCNETINQLVRPYARSLPIMLDELQTYLIGAVFSHSDDFGFVADVMENPEKYGITNTTRQCCYLERPNTPICTNRDEYLYFDFAHPTQAANYIFSLNCFSGTLCSPVNIRHLVGAD